MEGDELWYEEDDAAYQMQAMGQDSEHFALVEDAEKIADCHTIITTPRLGRLVSSLQFAIQLTTNDELAKRMGRVRDRLLVILSARNEERVNELLWYIELNVDKAERALTLAIVETNSWSETVKCYEDVVACFHNISDAFNELHTRRYLQVISVERQGEIELLKGKIAKLRAEYEKYPQVVRAASLRSEAEPQ